MESLELTDVTPSTDDSINKASRLRFVENVATNLSNKWAILGVAAAEVIDRGTSADSSGEWQSVGVRPIYSFTDHYQLLMEAGYSRIRMDNEVDAGGAKLGTRELTRLTIAPQMSFGRDIWARPVMRIFYTQSFWNKANQTKISTDAPSFAQSQQGSSFGYQAEVWF
jgi:maltoporin